MKQVLFRAGHPALCEVPAPLVEPGHVLVQTAYSLISTGTELITLRASAPSLVRRAVAEPAKVLQLLEHLQAQGIRRTIEVLRFRLGTTTPVGYSCSGTVIQVGQGVHEFHPGDRVACAGAGYANHADFVLVPLNLVVRVPEGCDLRDAASVGLGAIAIQGVRRAHVQLGEFVGVIGLGLIGQLTAQLLKASGCRVIGVDLSSDRVELATALGMDHGLVGSDTDVVRAVLHLTEGQGVDAAIITAASESDAVIQKAIEITRQKGRVVVVGAVGMALQRSPFYEKELDVLISTSYGPGRYDSRYEVEGVDYPYAYVRWTERRNMAEYLRLVASQQVNVKAIVKETVNVEKAEEAYVQLQAPINGRPLGLLLAYGDTTDPIEEGEQRCIAVSPTREVRKVKTAGRVNLALVGPGTFARGVHLPNLKRLSNQFYLRAVVSTRGSHAWDVARQYGADYCTCDLEQVLADPDVDAVLICTRHHLHARQAMAALQAGKHVYVEKPLCLNEGELDDILGCYRFSHKSFQGSNRIDAPKGSPILMVGFNRRFSLAARRMKEIVATRTNPLMAFYRVNAGYLPPDHWVHGPQGGGRFIGEACHMIDLCTFLVDAEIESVAVEALRPRTDHVLDSDNVSTTIRYVDGSVCTLVYTALGTEVVPKERVEVFVDGKVLILDDFRELKVYGSREKGWSSPMVEKGHREALAGFASSVLQDAGWPIPLHQLVSTTLATFVAGSV